MKKIFLSVLMAFTIFSINAQVVVFDSPNSGTQWHAGTSQEVMVANNGSTNYNNGSVELFKGGVSQGTVIASFNFMQGSAMETWNIPSNLTPAADYSLVAFDDANVQLAQSDNFEILAPQGTINSITSPESNYYWYNGNSYDITWTSTNVANVKIEYSTDGGGNWTTIIASVANTNTYNWAVSGIDATYDNSMIRVSDASDASIHMTSGIFTLSDSPMLSFVDPNATTSWEVGTSHDVNVNSNIAGTTVDISLFKGTSDLGMILNMNLGSTGVNTENWNISSSLNPGNDYILVAYDSGSGEEVARSAEFTITTPAGAITSVFEPDVNSFWYNGMNVNIQWASNYVANVKIEYTLDNGGIWTTIIASVANTNIYNWNVTGIVGTNTTAKIRVSDASDNTIFAESNNFTLAESLPITFTAPISTTQWTAGTQQTISYTSTGNYTGVEVFIAKTGINQVLLGIYNITTGNGTINWNIPLNYVPGTDYQVVFNSTPSAIGVSDNFEVVASPPAITSVNSPKLCNWINGKTYNIGWTSTDVTNVKIEYSINNGSTWNTIIASVANADIYAWSVTGITGINPNSLVKVSDASDANVFAISSPFTLSDNSCLSFTNITTSTQWTLGSAQNIVVENTGGKIFNYVIEVKKGGSSLFPEQYVYFTNDTIFPGTNNASWYINDQNYTVGNDYTLVITDWNVENTTSEVFEIVASSGTATLTTTSPAVDFGNILVGHTDTKMIQIAGTDLTGNINLSVPANSGFFISDNGTNFSNSLMFSPSNGGGLFYVWVQFAPTTVNSYSENLLVESYGATSLNIPLTGNATVGIDNISENNISIYPNPTNGEFIIENQQEISKIEIFDITGKSVKQLLPNSKNVSVNINNQANGIYFIKIISENKIITKKIVIRK